MASPFSRTIRSLDHNRFRLSLLTLLAVALVLGGWVTWFAMARVSLYEITANARLESNQAAHTVAAQVFGRVTKSNLTLGREVKHGDVLLELDDEAQRLQLREEQTRVTALTAQLAALRGQINAEQQAATEKKQVAPVALDETRAKYDEAQAVVHAANEQAKRLATLHAEGIVAEMEVIRAQAEAENLRAAAASIRIGLNRQDKDQNVTSLDRQVQIESLCRDVAVLEGEIATKQATIARLQHDSTERHILAPVSGKIGKVVDIHIGTIIRAGEELAAIVPSGELRAVAEFAPSESLGRIRVGQTAKLRMEGFPWTEYGKVAATVTSVGSEPRSGQIRVELAVQPEAGSRIPLQHGMPGTMEIAVEQASPLQLALRAVGKWLR